MILSTSNRDQSFDAEILKLLGLIGLFITNMEMHGNVTCAKISFIEKQ